MITKYKIFERVNELDPWGEEDWDYDDKYDIEKEKIKYRVRRRAEMEVEDRNRRMLEFIRSINDRFDREELFRTKKMKKFKNTDLNYQGTYELDFLNKYYEKLDLKNCQSIYYTFNNKMKIYFPDFYVPYKNLIVEIKSNYTYNLEIEQNRSKQKSCLDSGYNFIFIIDKDYTEFDKLVKDVDQ